MESKFRDVFLDQWSRHFPGAGLPMTLAYSEEQGNAERVKNPPGHQCLIGVLNRVRSGKSICFDADSVSCFGGKRYLGFSTGLSPTFDRFLSTGIPGQLEGERYKKSPELVREVVAQWPDFKAPARYAVFKRWDRLEERDHPEVVIFWAQPTVLSGLFTLANFDHPGPEGVIAPFCAGCASIVMYPWMERDAEHPRAVLGMFDVSARPFVPASTLSFAVPLSKFKTMVGNMEESFLITPSWGKARKRISGD